MIGKWRYALFAVLCMINLAVLYVPSPPPVGASIPGLDKAVHIAIFALPMATGMLARLPAGWLGAPLVLNAIGSEVIQHYLLPDRTGDPFDVLANLVGVLVGWVVARRLLRSRQADA